MKLENIFVGERTHPEDEEGINIARYDFASKYIKNKKVIDLGCGSGYGTSILAQNGAKSVMGIDYDPKVIAFAKKKYQLKNLSYSNTDSTKLKKENKYEVVTAFEVIEHIQDDSGFVKTIQMLLDKNGLALISTPNKLISSPHTNTPPNPYHVREYEPDQLIQLLSGYFSHVELYGIRTKSRDKLNLENEVKNNIRWRISSWIVGRRVFRRITNFLPRNIKRAFTGENKLEFVRSDFGFYKKDIYSSPYLLAICQP